VGGCVVISDKAQRMRKWALSWAQYRRRDRAGQHDEDNRSRTCQQVLYSTKIVLSQPQTGKRNNKV